jgi:hypothetical protein
MATKTKHWLFVLLFIAQPFLWYLGYHAGGAMYFAVTNDIHIITILSICIAGAAVFGVTPLAVLALWIRVTESNNNDRSPDS